MGQLDLCPSTQLTTGTCRGVSCDLGYNAEFAGLRRLLVARALQSGGALPRYKLW